MDSSAVSFLGGVAVCCHHFLSLFFHKFGLIHSTIHKCEVVITCRKVAKQYRQEEWLLASLFSSQGAMLATLAFTCNCEARGTPPCSRVEYKGHLLSWITDCVGLICTAVCPVREAGGGESGEDEPTPAATDTSRAKGNSCCPTGECHCHSVSFLYGTSVEYWQFCHCVPLFFPSWAAECFNVTTEESSHREPRYILTALWLPEFLPSSSGPSSEDNMLNIYCPANVLDLKRDWDALGDDCLHCTPHW